jgi:hypothetical protein
MRGAAGRDTHTLSSLPHIGCCETKLYNEPLESSHDSDVAFLHPLTNLLRSVMRPASSVGRKAGKVGASRLRPLENVQLK